VATREADVTEPERRPSHPGLESAIMGSMENGKSERELYRQIIRRAKRSRERAAETLRRSRLRDDDERKAGAPNRRRKPRKQD
jgi:hypothetical protein